MRRGLTSVVLGITAVACQRDPTCAELARRQRWAEAIPICRAAFAGGVHPDDGVRLVIALERQQRIADAAPVARALLDLGHAADGAYYLGLAAMQAERYGEAEAWLGRAIDGYRAAQDHHRVAEAMHQRVGIRVARGEYRAAAEELEAAVPAAERAGDPRLLGYFELARADVLRRTGDVVAAERALERAIVALDDDPRDRAWARLKLGILHLENRHLAAARVPLEWVVANAGDRGDIVDAARLNLAWLASQAGELARAAAYLDEVRAEDRAPSTLVSLAFGDATVRALRGELAAADAILAAVDPTALGDEWAWIVPLYRGRLAARRGDLAGATTMLERAVAAIDRQRRVGVVDEPIYLDAHREPYYELFALHARAGRWDDALAQLVALDAGDLLEASGGGLLRWGWAGGPQRPPPRTAPLDAAGLRGRVTALRASSRHGELVLAILVGDELWRIVLRDGGVSGQVVGARDDVEGLIGRMVVDPGDRAAGGRLGQMLVPHPDGRGTLYLAPLGELAAIPLAALEVGGRRVIANRPVVRLVTLAASPSPSPSPSSSAPRVPAEVFGDPRGDLAWAALESRLAAIYLQVEPTVGSAVTAERLLAARGQVIHLAAHSGLDDRGGFVRVADRPVHVDEIAATSWRSDLVVLASCGSAAARDRQGRGSLAGGFVRGGARAVLGSLWSVEDAATARVLGRFYAAGGADDPAAGLAAAQRELADTLPARQWAAFVVVSAPPMR